MFEHRSQPLLHRRAFLRRLLLSGALGLLIIVISLAGGMLGYHRLLRLDWADAFVNAAMILSGMGPLAAPDTLAGKLFAGLYALYSGFALLVVSGITFAPVVHRLFHALHADIPGADIPGADIPGEAGGEPD